ncbi:globin family protein [Pelagicoccus sp. SDUM812005]|uniref:globin family protein n=1 Tax=Pelagicoccus sp. SDUM812005 TaxID=3041257 RepID=UPI00280D6418|nr:globin family protein [Pelagicoccus sp. SDUM812005]MDQ8179795.1 globin family protein [Pelagicoccus sp. SDUM812005]
MTERQIELVQTSWEKCIPIADTAAAIFYAKLFELDPSLRPLFTSDIKEQGKKLMTMITTAVRGLNNLEGIVGAVQAMGKRHSGYGVKDQHYETVGTALIWTLGQGLGDDFTDETKEAWIATYTLLATTMKDAANENAA